MSYRCPNCHESGGLWEGVEISGWRSIDEHLVAAGDRGADWLSVERTGTIGCSCGWEGMKSGLDRLGIDGEPLPGVHPGQLDLEAAA